MKNNNKMLETVSTVDVRKFIATMSKVAPLLNYNELHQILMICDTAITRTEGEIENGNRIKGKTETGL